jgi:hypothetical protein
MFKVSHRNDREIRLRHVPEGHQYTFPVIASSTCYTLGLGEIADNPYASTSAYRFARQARRFALAIVSDEWWLELPPLEPPSHDPSKLFSYDRELYSEQQFVSTEKRLPSIKFLFVVAILLLLILLSGLIGYL